MPAVGDLLLFSHVDHDSVPGRGYAVCYKQPAQQAYVVAAGFCIDAEKATVLEVAAYRADQMAESQFAASPPDDLAVRRIDQIAPGEDDSQPDFSRVNAHRFYLLESLAVVDPGGGCIRSLACHFGLEGRGHSCLERVSRHRV